MLLQAFCFSSFTQFGDKEEDQGTRTEYGAEEQPAAEAAVTAAATEGVVLFLTEDKNVAEIVKNHVKWDDGDSEQIVNWLYALQGMENGVDVLKARL